MRACLAALLLATSALGQQPPGDPPPPQPEIRLRQQPPTLEQVQKKIEHMKRLTPEQMAKEAEELSKRLEVPQSDPEPADDAPYDGLSGPEPKRVAYWARLFFEQLLAGNAHGLVDLSGFPFQLEGHRLADREALYQEWTLQLRARRTDLLTLYGIEVLTPKEMEAKYGKPPARVAALPWRGADTYVAVANVSGKAAIAVLRPLDGEWAVIGFHD